jgi:hypothetical protein
VPDLVEVNKKEAETISRFILYQDIASMEVTVEKPLFMGHSDLLSNCVYDLTLFLKGFPERLATDSKREFFQGMTIGDVLGDKQGILK